MAIIDGQSLVEAYKHLFVDLGKLMTVESKITEENVLQQGNAAILKIIDEILDDTILPGSRLEGLENLKDFLDRVKAGKRGLILMEHYSNFDLPGLVHLLCKNGGETGNELARRLVAIAGMKLNEDDPMVRAFASAYERIVIYPSRSLASITDPAEREIEEKRSRTINMASMRALDKVRKEGKVILVFPSGTRYRPENPETKKGVREIDSYLRLSDVMITISINGNCLRISDKDPKNMMADEVWHDRVVFAAGQVLDCRKFRDDIQTKLGDSVEDKKQPVVDRIMELLREQHDFYEKGRLD